ncbi:MAG TPA: hypothetical protein VFO49_21140 [Nocardioides sp.]|nr:hypothetical protein [Nocardioides sp.]
MTTRSNRSAWVGVLIAATVTLSACGDDDDGGAGGPGRHQNATGEIREVVPVVAAYDAWLAALKAHDAEGACARHAPELTIERRQRAILKHRAELGDPCVGFVALLWEDPAREYLPLDIEVTQETGEDGELAVDFPGTDETVSMQRRNGRWLVADVTPRSAGDADTARWVQGWCDLSLDMRRDEVVAVMGPPSGEYTVANGGEPQLWWADRQYDFRVYLDLDGRLLDLVGDYDRLDAADRQLLDCPELR